VRLQDIAELFLVHDRPIVRHVDDSIARLMLEREMVLRRARGFAPLPVTPGFPAPGFSFQVRSRESQTILAVGAHLKNTVALSVGPQVFISQHIGDLETIEAYRAFGDVLTDLQALYEIKPELVGCDLHPDYLSTKRASEFAVPKVFVQHHYAHILSCMTENEVASPALGVSWDGTGYGTDGTIWGGEFLLVNDSDFVRFAHLRQFSLPGGEAAIREPRRTALGLLYEAYGDSIFESDRMLPPAVFTSSEVTVLRGMLTKGINTPMTSSAGRLFDAVAALLGLCRRATFEGEAAMALEFAIGDIRSDESYPFEFGMHESILTLDWKPAIAQVIADRDNGVATALVSARFHNTLVEMIVAVAKRCSQEKIALSGGCFQNRYLTERTINRLRAEGFHPYWHQRVPPNDGGIALGQIVAAARAHLRK
jgi:hydrogenase maturation protein HypF